jgi:hypothetical protein
MARSRILKPQFFLNEKLAECDPLARLLYAALWCVADKKGRLEDRPKLVGVQSLPYDHADVDALLGQLAAAGFIRRYTVRGQKLIDIPAFERHQRPHCREQESELPGFEEADLGNKARGLHEACPGQQRTTEAVTGTDLGSAEASPRCPVSISVSDSVSDSVSKEIPPVETGDSYAGSRTKKLDPAFEAWYAAYPRRVKPKEAAQAWAKALQSIKTGRGVSREAAIAALQEAAEAFAASRVGQSDFCPHPATWLNQGRYDDDRSEWSRSVVANGASKNVIGPGQKYDPLRPCKW